MQPSRHYVKARGGRSAKQPFCDGSHKGTDFTPKPFKADKGETAYLCACKHTANTPFCDGSHKQFSQDQVGQEGPGLSTTNNQEMPAATPTPEEPTVALIHQLAKEGLTQMGHHGPMTAMGVPRNQLPHWDDIQIMTAQLAQRPLMEDQAVGTELIIGPESKKPLVLKVPLFTSDMSFGALSEEAKVAMARGAEMVGTGMLPEEQAENSRYFYELASAKFGYDEAAC